MAKGKSVFVEFKCPISGIRLKTTTINKTKHKPADIAKKVYSKGAKQRVTPVVKEIKRSK